MINGTPDPTMGEGDAGSPGQPGDQPPKSVEEVEAFWKYRQSQSDKAHAAEVAAFNAQIEALRAAPAPPPEGESPDAARVRELEEALQKAQSAQLALTLQAKYPLTASVLGEAMVNLPESSLAASEAAYEAGAPGGPPRMDLNQAARRPAGVPGTNDKPLNQKSKDELLADLRRITPAYEAVMREER